MFHFMYERKKDNSMNCRNHFFFLLLVAPQVCHLCNRKQLVDGYVGPLLSDKRKERKKTCYVFFFFLMCHYSQKIKFLTNIRKSSS